VIFGPADPWGDGFLRAGVSDEEGKVFGRADGSDPAGSRFRDGGRFGKKHGVSEQTIYLSRKRFGQLEARDVRRLRQLEQENARFKRLVAERVLELEVMKEINGKMYDPPRVCKGFFEGVAGRSA